MSSHAEAALGSGAMFDAIARRYDLLNRINSLGRDRAWRTRAVEALAVQPGQQVLDLATGTADLAISIAKNEPRARIFGLDPSEGMLAIGREKIAALGLAERIALDRGDATRLPFAAASFERVAMAFGLRNLAPAERERALEEMARVLRPDGRLVILELCVPDSGVLAPLARWYIEQIVPRVGALLSGAREYRHLERSIASFPAPEQLAERFPRAGLVVKTIERLTFGACALFVAEKAGGA